MNERDLERILKALGNKRRLAAVNYIRKEKVASVTAIAKNIKLSLRSTSRHLGILLTADILEREQAGLMVYYNISKDAPLIVKEILKFL